MKKVLTILVFFELTLVAITSAQIIDFSPDIDTVYAWSGCTPPLVKGTLGTGIYSDTIKISADFNTALFDNHNRFIDICYFIIADSVNIYRYELWYYPIAFCLDTSSHIIELDSPYDVFGLCRLVVKVFDDTTLIDSLGIFFKGEMSPAVRDQKQTDLPQLVLMANYPNPFNIQTNIRFRIFIKSELVLDLFDLSGRLIITKKIGSFHPGVHNFTFDAEGLATGSYLYMLKNNRNRQIGKFTVLK